MKILHNNVIYLYLYLRLYMNRSLTSSLTILRRFSTERKEHTNDFLIVNFSRLTIISNLTIGKIVFLVNQLNR